MKVTFLPMNKTFEARAGESLLDVAIVNEIPMQHACGGFCACTTCHVVVEAGEAGLTPMEDDEEDRLERVAEGLTLRSRLGCQARLTATSGDVTVRVQNLEE